MQIVFDVRFYQDEELLTQFTVMASISLYFLNIFISMDFSTYVLNEILHLLRSVI